MANKTIEDLVAAGAITDADLLMLVQGGNSRKVDIAALKAALAGLVSANTYIAPFKGCLLTRTSDQTGVSFPISVAWQAAQYDTNAFWNAGSATRITIPAGVTKARFTAQLALEGLAVAGGFFLGLYKNGVLGYPAEAVSSVRSDSSGYTNNVQGLVSPVLPVVAGDYFELYVNTNMAGVDQVLATRSWFQCEVMEGDAGVL